ncbi:MAG TPA: pseudouridine synthase [Candidatus Baltobacteraceae bacterium]|nr:pseudouridine synthase [Candidatus Baltobacteraceae bacterium]
MSVRLQKFLAEAGVASRRAGEQFILDGRVSVNGKQVRLLGTKIDPLHDAVLVDGKPVRAKKKLYIALHKPRGCVCSHKDELNRPTIYELLPKEWQIVSSVGRLDFNSEGLIFLTNDGQFALRLTHPRYGVRKKYVVTVEGKVEHEMLEKFTHGIFHGGEKLKAERAWLISATKSQSVVELELSEGKNREVRRLFESQNLTVKRLQRTQIGKIKLGELKLGKWRALTETEIKTLLSES